MDPVGQPTSTRLGSRRQPATTSVFWPTPVDNSIPSRRLRAIRVLGPRAGAQAVLAGLLVLAAVYLHVASFSVVQYDRLIECGSLAQLADDNPVVTDTCFESAQSIRVMRLGMILALLFLVVAPITWQVARRAADDRAFRLSDGSTTLRWLRRSDRRTLTATIDDDAMVALGWTPADVSAFVGASTAGPSTGVLVVTDSDSRELVGAVLMRPVAGRPSTVTSGWIGPTHRGHGHAHSASRLVADHLTEAGTSPIAIVTERAATSILEPLGFERVGSQRPMSDGPQFVQVKRVAPAIASTPPTGRRAWQLAKARGHRRGLMVLGLLLAYWMFNAASQHFAQVTASDGFTACGALVAPLDFSNDRWNPCEIAMFEQSIHRNTDIVASVVTLFVLIGTVVSAWWRRPLNAEAFESPLDALDLRSHVRTAAPLVDGPTCVRPAVTGDADAIDQTIDDVVIEALGWPQRERLGRHQAIAFGCGPAVIAVTRTDDPTGRPIGAIELTSVNRARGNGSPTVSVTMWCGPTARNEGHMSRAIGLLATVFSQRGIELCADVDADNVAAQRVFERANFVTRSQRQASGSHGARETVIAYSRSAADRSELTKLVDPNPRPALTIWRLSRSYVALTLATFVIVAPFSNLWPLGFLAGGIMLIMAVMIAAVSSLRSQDSWRSRRPVGGFELVDDTTRVRWATPNDRYVFDRPADGVVDEHFRLTPDETRYLRTRMNLAARSGLMVINRADGHVPIGVIDFAAQGSPSSLIRVRLWVDPAHRRHGHARGALQLVADHFCTRGATLVISVAADNEAAVALVTAAGLERVELSGDPAADDVDPRCVEFVAVPRELAIDVGRLERATTAPSPANWPPPKIG